MFSVMWKGRQKSHQSRKEGKEGNETCDISEERTLWREDGPAGGHGRAVREGDI